MRILTSSRVILISHRLKQCSLENTAKSDRGRYYRDMYVSGTGRYYTYAVCLHKEATSRVGEMRSWVRGNLLWQPAGEVLTWFPDIPSSRLATLSVNPHSLRRPFVPWAFTTFSLHRRRAFLLFLTVFLYLMILAIAHCIEVLPLSYSILCFVMILLFLSTPILCTHGWCFNPLNNSLQLLLLLAVLHQRLCVYRKTWSVRATIFDI